MKRLLVFSALIAFAVPAAHAADDDAAKAAKKLEGTYEVVSAIRGGKPDEMAKHIDKFAFKDGKVVITLKEAGELTGTFTVDPGKKPAQLDLVRDNGSKDTLKGIYETKETDDGLELTYAFGRDGGERPKDFKAESDKEVCVKLLRRKAK
jgi:uncharacterized protein (TIGR03067 family)